MSPEALAEVLNALGGDSSNHRVDSQPSTRLATPQEAAAEVNQQSLNKPQDEAKHLQRIIKLAVKKSSNLQSTMTTQTLQWAITHTITYPDRLGFTYFKDGASHSSSDLVEVILFSFLQGHGHWLPKGASLGLDGMFGYSTSREDETVFHAKVVGQLHALTGVRPRVSEQAPGRFIIFRV